MKLKMLLALAAFVSVAGISAAETKHKDRVTLPIQASDTNFFRNKSAYRCEESPGGTRSWHKSVPVSEEEALEALGLKILDLRSISKIVTLYPTTGSGAPLYYSIATPPKKPVGGPTVCPGPKNPKPKKDPEEGSTVFVSPGHYEVTFFAQKLRPRK